MGGKDTSASDNTDTGSTVPSVEAHGLDDDLDHDDVGCDAFEFEDFGFEDFQGDEGLLH